MIEAENIAYSYDGIRQMSFPDVVCDNGKACLILGPSGSGKTTLLHILAGLLPPKNGSVKVAQKNVYDLSSSEMRKWRANRIGVVYQVPHFIAALSMVDNLILTQKLASRKVNRREIEDYFNQLEIGHRLDAKPSELSQGELQRASLIRAIINEPDVIFADEPTSALDDESAQKVIRLLKLFAEQNGSALIIVTHDRRIQDEVEHKIILEKR